MQRYNGWVEVGGADCISKQCSLDALIVRQPTISDLIEGLLPHPVSFWHRMLIVASYIGTIHRGRAQDEVEKPELEQSAVSHFGVHLLPRPRQLAFTLIGRRGNGDNPCMSRHQDSQYKDVITIELALL